MSNCGILVFGAREGEFKVNSQGPVRDSGVLHSQFALRVSRITVSSRFHTSPRVKDCGGAR